jgi:putative endonuclease
VLYTGVTGDLRGRVHQHREKLIPGFTSRYNVNKLVYYEVAYDPSSAITREKQIKAGSRQKKLISSM